MRRYQLFINDNDNFSPKDGAIIAILVILAILFAAAVYREKNNETIILEATKKTSQVTVEDVGWI